MTVKCADYSVGAKPAKNNSKGRIIEVQEYCRIQKLYNRQVDGIPGPFTIAAIKTLQKNQGNSQDGWFGPKSCQKSDILELANKKITTKNTAVVGTQTSNRKIHKTTFMKQPDRYTCGPASVAMLFSAYGINADIKTLANHMFTNNNGTSPGNMIAGVSKFNPKFGLIQSGDYSFKKLCDLLDKFKGLILQLQTQNPNNQRIKSCMDYWDTYGHYVECSGYDKNKNTLLINDPSRGFKELPYSCIKQAMDWRQAIGRVSPVYHFNI